MTKPKLTPEEKAKFEKLRKEIADREHKDAWRNVILGKIKLLELTLKYDWRSDLRNEMLLDKHLVTLRPWAYRWKHKKNGGKGWKDDC